MNTVNIVSKQCLLDFVRSTCLNILSNVCVHENSCVLLTNMAERVHTTWISYLKKLYVACIAYVKFISKYSYAI